MLPFGIGFSEILLILVVLLLVVGPQKLPELAKSLGKGVRVARRASDELKAAVAAEEMNHRRPWEQDDKIEDAVTDTQDYPSVEDDIQSHTTSSKPANTDPSTPDGDVQDQAVEGVENTVDDLVEEEDFDPSKPVARDPGTLVKVQANQMTEDRLADGFDSADPAVASDANGEHLVSTSQPVVVDSEDDEVSSSGVTLDAPGKVGENGA